MKDHRLRSVGVCSLAIMLTLLVTNTHAQVFDYVIAKDGTGDYSSFSAAINRLPLNKTERTLIYVKNGIYREKVNFYKSHQNFSLIGEDKGKVIISWDDYSGDDAGHTTSSSYTFQAEGDGFYTESIIFENTAGDVGQAVAVSVTGNHQVFKNCDFLGFQDTYYVKKGMQFNLDCYAEGATDFIFGESTAVFQNCQIKCLSGGQYITAPADTKLISSVGEKNFYHGILFLNSEILAGEGVSDNSYYLGRPWQPNASSVYINCIYEDHIRAEGWSTWSDNNHLTGFFAEYNNTDPSGAPIDVSGRVDWSAQLTAEEVENYYNPDYFLNGWNPIPITEALATPQNIIRNTENKEFFELNWDEVVGVKGYVITKNDSTIGFSETASFIDETAASNDFYKVRSVSQSGALSDYSNEMEGKEVGANILSVGSQVDLRVINKQLKTREPVNVTIYSISGRLTYKQRNVQNVDMNSFQPGIYLVHIVDREAKVRIVKIAL